MNWINTWMMAMQLNISTIDLHWSKLSGLVDSTLLLLEIRLRSIEHAFLKNYFKTYKREKFQFAFAFNK